MTHVERIELREKHKLIKWHELEICDECDFHYPCDVIKVLDYLDVVEPMPEINWAGGK